MRIYIIRHGLRADFEPDYDGGSNPPLGKIGHRQAEHLAEFMAGEGIDGLYSSCMLRALQTAAPLHQKIGGDWNVWPVFCETDIRAWDARRQDDPDVAARAAAWPTGESVPVPTPEEVEAREGNYYLLSSLAKRFPGVKLTQPLRWPDAWWTSLEGGCRETGYARLELGIRALLSRHNDDDRVAVVGHGNSGDMLLRILMDFPREPLRRFWTDNACVSRVDIDENGQRRLMYTNSTDHLPRELRI